MYLGEVSEGELARYAHHFDPWYKEELCRQWREWVCPGSEWQWLDLPWKRSRRDHRKSIIEALREDGRNAPLRSRLSLHLRPPPGLDKLCGYQPREERQLQSTSWWHPRYRSASRSAS